MEGPIASWPTGVGRLVAEYDVDGFPATIQSWFLDPSAAGASYGSALAIADQWIGTCGHSISNLTSSASALTACSVTYGGAIVARARRQVEPVPGIWPGAQAMNVVVGIRFVGDWRGRGAPCLMHLPSTPDNFIADTARLSHSGYANLLTHGNSYLDYFNELVGAGEAFLIHGCLHFIRNGAELAPPQFVITEGVTPIQRVGTMRRRLPSGRQISPA